MPIQNECPAFADTCGALDTLEVAMCESQQGVVATEAEMQTFQMRVAQVICQAPRELRSPRAAHSAWLTRRTSNWHRRAWRRRKSITCTR